eukprot:3190653-Pleurochrysis_carterae.AAC.1
MLVLFTEPGWQGPFDGTWGVSEWTLLSGKAVFANRARNLSVYTKVVEPGSYLLDNRSAFYLFGDAHGLSPT